jgi:hypothetical protein
LLNYTKPEDLTGENGLFKHLKKALIGRALGAECRATRDRVRLLRRQVQHRPACSPREEHRARLERRRVRAWLSVGQRRTHQPQAGLSQSRMAGSARSRLPPSRTRSSSGRRPQCYAWPTWTRSVAALSGSHPSSIRQSNSAALSGVGYTALPAPVRQFLAVRQPVANP